MQPIQFSILSVLTDLREGVSEAAAGLPEPASYALVIGGLFALAGVLRRRFRGYISIH
ncbi:MAG: PEP-CTERM sorting domain-containing protein [Opitutales bacterium]